MGQTQQTWVIQCPLPSVSQVPSGLTSGGVGKAVGSLKCSKGLKGPCRSGEGVLRTPRLLLKADFYGGSLMAYWGSRKNHRLSQGSTGHRTDAQFIFIKHILGLGPGCPTKDCSRL